LATDQKFSDQPRHFVTKKTLTTPYGRTTNHLQLNELYSIREIKSNQTNYIIERPKVDQRAAQLSLPHVGITKTEKIELKRKTDEQINPVNGLEP